MAKANRKKDLFITDTMRLPEPDDDHRQDDGSHHGQRDPTPPATGTSTTAKLDVPNHLKNFYDGSDNISYFQWQENKRNIYQGLYLSGMGKCSTSFPLVRLEALVGGCRNKDMRELWLRTTGRWERVTLTNPLRAAAVDVACRKRGGEEDGEDVDILNVPSEMGGKECLADDDDGWWPTPSPSTALWTVGELIAFKSTQLDGHDRLSGLGSKLSTIDSDCIANRLDFPFSASDRARRHPSTIRSNHQTGQHASESSRLSFVTIGV